MMIKGQRYYYVTMSGWSRKKPESHPPPEMDVETEIVLTYKKFCQYCRTDSPLLEIMKQVAQFHMRVKDIHNLVKRCLLFWVNKNRKKLDERKRKAEERKLARREKVVPVINLADEEQKSTIDLSSSLEAMSISIFSNSDYSSGGIVLPPTVSPIKEISPPKEVKVKTLSKIQDVIPTNAVFMTLRQILHLSGLSKLLGSARNQRRYHRFLRKSLSLAGTKSALHLGQMMAELEVKDCDWMPTETVESTKTCVLAKVGVWIFRRYIMTILKTSFYVTELSNTRFHAAFYLRDTWKSVYRRTCDGLREIGSLQHRNDCCQGRSKRLARRNYSVPNSKIRFIPKKNNTLRPIVSLRKTKDSKYVEIERRTKRVMEYYIANFCPHQIRCIHKIRRKWLTFLQEWRDMGKPKLYFVRADIRNAYPSVHMEKLKEILTQVAEELGPMLEFDFKVHSRTKLVVRKVVLSNNHNYPTCWAADIKSRPCLIQNVNRDPVKFHPMQLFQALLPFNFENVVQVGQHQFAFKQGLPQGWILSDPYCNLYYSSMDKEHFSEYMNKPGEMFCTSADDYLYITPYPKDASQFLKTIQPGIPSYSCEFNAAKIVTNLFPAFGPVPSQGCEWVQFCGWMYCLTCGHIMRDFSNYVGLDMASTITFIPRFGNPESFLMDRMKITIVARLHHFLLDPAINCKARIVLNIWEAGLVFSFRLYAICRVVFPSLESLRHPARARRCVASIITNAGCLNSVVQNCFRVTYASTNGSGAPCSSEACKCIQSYKEGFGSGPIPIPQEHSSSPNNFPLTNDEVKYIIFHAYGLKLKRHASVFQEVLPRLNKLTQKTLSRLNPESFAFLSSILEPKIPAHFEQIRI